MSNTPKIARRAAVSARKAQQAADQQNVTFAAMREGASQSEAIDMVKRALGKARPDSDKPADKALFETTRHAYQTGRMAFALFAGSNIPDVEKLAKAKVARDSADCEGKGKLKTGQRRRTKAEQAAYNSAKVAWSRLLNAAGLVTQDKRGGATNAKGTRPDRPASAKAQAKADGKESVSISAADAAKYVPPKVADVGKASAFVRQQASMLLAFVESANQRAMKVSNETLPVAMCSAVADFKAAIDAIK